MGLAMTVFDNQQIDFHTGTINMVLLNNRLGTSLNFGLFGFFIFFEGTSQPRLKKARSKFKLGGSPWPDSKISNGIMPKGFASTPFIPVGLYVHVNHRRGKMRKKLRKRAVGLYRFTGHHDNDDNMIKYTSDKSIETCRRDGPHIVLF